MLYLIQHKMTSLSGMAQKIILNILEQIVNQGMFEIFNLHCNINITQSIRAQIRL